MRTPRSPRRTEGLAAVVGAAAAFVTWRALRQARRLAVRRRRVRLPGWPAELDGFRMAVLSDLHAGGPHVLSCFENVYGDTNAILRTSALRAVGGYENDRGSPWEDWMTFVKLYNAGHLYEAAVAHFMATGKRTLFDVALKNADLVVFNKADGERAHAAESDATSLRARSRPGAAVMPAADVFVRARR